MNAYLLLLDLLWSQTFLITSAAYLHTEEPQQTYMNTLKTFLFEANKQIWWTR